MSKRGEVKNLSKVIQDVFSQKHFRIGIDNVKVQDQIFLLYFLIQKEHP